MARSLIWWLFFVPLIRGLFEKVQQSTEERLQIVSVRLRPPVCELSCRFLNVHEAWSLNLFEASSEGWEMMEVQLIFSQRLHNVFSCQKTNCSCSSDFTSVIWLIFGHSYPLDPRDGTTGSIWSIRLSFFSELELISYTGMLINIRQNTLMLVLYATYVYKRFTNIPFSPAKKHKSQYSKPALSVAS